MYKEPEVSGTWLIKESNNIFDSGAEWGIKLGGTRVYGALLHFTQCRANEVI